MLASRKPARAMRPFRAPNDALRGTDRCSHVFRREKHWEFEVGVHYLGDCGPSGQVPTMLRGLALDERIEFLPLDP